MVEFIFPKDARPHSAAEIGAALAGLIVREPSGLPRVGMLGEGPAVAAAGSSWKVEVGPFVYAHQVSGSVSFSGITSAQQVDIVSAAGIPAGQSRIDLVCWDVAAAELVPVQGTPAAIPSEPSTALALVGRVLVKSGDGMVIAGQVSPVFTLSGLAGSSDFTYTPTISGYEAGFNPVVRASYHRAGDVVEVEVQAETERQMVRVTGPILVSVPFPIGSYPISVDGGGYFLAGPEGSKRILDLRVRHASPTQVVLEAVKVSAGQVMERVALTHAGLASTDLVSWRARFRYTVG